MHATVQSRRTNFLQFIALQVPRDETRRMGKLRHKVKRSYPVTFSLCETITPGDDNHLLPPQFSGRDILAFARSRPALYLRLSYDSRGDASTRCRLGARRRWPRARKVIDRIFSVYAQPPRNSFCAAKSNGQSHPENSGKNVCHIYFILGRSPCT